MKGSNTRHPCYALVAAITSMKERNWSLRFQWCYREANKVADRLACYAFNPVMPASPAMFFNSPPDCRRAEFSWDLWNMSFPRVCAVSLLSAVPVDRKKEIIKNIQFHALLLLLFYKHFLSRGYINSFLSLTYIT